MGYALGRILGIIGGLGPLASAELVKTIYEYSRAPTEQQLPVCILLSDPTCPDRSDAIESGSAAEVTESLTRSLETLCEVGASKVVIACVTMHYFLPMIAPALRMKVLSLVDLTIEQLQHSQNTHLLLCSNGTRRAAIFQNHPQWNSVRRHVVLPTEDDQCVIHRLIYELKRNYDPESAMAVIDALQVKYRTNAIVAGCTEIHLLTKHLIAGGSTRSECSVVDPLMTVAKDLTRLLDH